MASQKIRSQKHVRQKRRRRRRQLVGIGILALILLAGLIGLSHWSQVQIASFEVEAENDLPKNEIRQIVDRQLEKRPWYLFSQRNILLLPRSAISQEVQTLSPRIKRTTVDITGLRSFIVNVQTREPAAVVCTQTNTGERDGCRFVDKTGFVYAAAQDNATSTNPFVYQIDTLPEIGENIFSPEVFALLESFLAQLPELGFQPLSATLRDHRDVFVRAKDRSAERVTASTTVQLRINLADDLSRKFTGLRTVVEKDAFVASSTQQGTGSAPSVSPFALEYIDLRFGNKVFYR